MAEACADTIASIPLKVKDQCIANLPVIVEKVAHALIPIDVPESAMFPVCVEPDDNCLSWTGSILAEMKSFMKRCVYG